MNILSVDFGTSSMKMEIFTDRLESLAATKVAYDLIITNHDWIELSPEQLWAAFRQGLEELRDYRESIALITYDTLSPSLVFMDREGRALTNIITHLDRRAKKQSRDILEKMDKEHFQSITGIYPFIGGCPLTTLLWVKENRPDIFDAAYKVGHLPSYILKRLTGTWGIDFCNATMMGMYETVTLKGWSEEICGTFGVPMDKLLPVKDAGSVQGFLKEEEARFLGLRPGIPVALGTNDCAITQVGAGNMRAGCILDVSGSSEAFSVLSDVPKHDSHYYLRGAAQPGLWQIFSISSSGFSVEWCRQQFYRDVTEEEFFGNVMERALAQEPGGTQVRFQPYLNGDRQSLEMKRGGFTQLTLDTTRDEMLAAIMNGVHEHILDTLHICEQIMPRMNREIVWCGGLMTEAIKRYKERLLPQYTFVQKENCALRGNVILALKQLPPELRLPTWNYCKM